MGLGDMFHDFFFGPSRRRPGSFEDSDQLFKHGPQIPGNRRDRDELEDFNSIFTESFGDMEKHMEMMQREMEAIFRRFGAIDMPFDSLPERGQSRRGDNPRDSMLKESESPPEGQISPLPSQPWGHRHFFDDFFRKFDTQEPGVKEDKDLDEEAKDIDIAKVFTDPKSGIVPSVPQRGGIFSSGGSISVTTIRGADGRVEQKRTVRDSSGREETTVTRTIGDQTHTVTTKVDPSGTPETTESFTNIDEGHKQDFNDKWDNSTGNPSRSSLLPDNQQINPGQSDDRSFYDRLFGIRLFGPKRDDK